MIKDLVSAQMPELPFIHNIGGAYNRDTLAATIVAMLNNGILRVRTYDLRDCFQNVNPQVFFNLPIPRKATENALIIDNLKMEPKAFASDHFTGSPYGDFNQCNIHDISNTNGPTGLIQGSPASNIILAYHFQNMPQLRREEGLIANYGDDVISISRENNSSDRVDEQLEGYGRNVVPTRSSEYIYNHIMCPPMLFWLAEASGVSDVDLRKAFRAVVTAKPNPAKRCAAFRKQVPWKTIEMSSNRQILMA